MKGTVNCLDGFPFPLSKADGKKRAAAILHYLADMGEVHVN